MDSKKSVNSKMKKIENNKFGKSRFNHEILNKRLYKILKSNEILIKLFSTEIWIDSFFYLKIIYFCKRQSMLMKFSLGNNRLENANL